jgi:starch synthase
MPMPLGLWSADAMVAVSPSYADEILTPDFGCGLQDFLLNRKDHLHGILNGLDVKSYNPEDDNALGFNFSIETLLQRIKNKKVLQERLRLPTNDHIPLLAMVSRMDPQKGIDIALKSLKMLAKENFQAVILGTGDPKLEEEALKLQEAFPEKIKVETRFDAGLARQIYAGADMFIMPSRYEPCGISQMIAMRYGCVPVVRAVGGLKDTVTHKESGFVFQKPHHLSLNYALKTALSLYPNREAWEKLQHNGMLKDFAWQISAKKYLELYQTLIANG